MALITITTARGQKTLETAELSREARRSVRERLDRNPRVKLYEVTAKTSEERRTWGDHQDWRTR